MPVQIFFCYAHEDEELLNKLKTHLKPLQRQGLIELWHDRDINAGTKWVQEIDQHLNAANIILLLISPDFMASDYCYSKEMKRAMERHERGEARVIPIILRHVYWQGEPLDKLQALPMDAKPATDPIWHNLDIAFYNITEGIRKVVITFLSQLEEQGIADTDHHTKRYNDFSDRTKKISALRRERELRGWSQFYVAEMIGADPKMVGRWERRTTSPSIYYRLKLCELFGKNAQELGFFDY